jgi:hypothetical protein
VAAGIVVTNALGDTGWCGCDEKVGDGEMDAGLLIEAE